MQITITGCTHTPRWDTLQTALREATNDVELTLTRINRRDKACGYRDPGIYDLTARTQHGDNLTIELNIQP